MTEKKKISVYNESCSASEAKMRNDKDRVNWINCSCPHVQGLFQGSTSVEYSQTLCLCEGRVETHCCFTLCSSFIHCCHNCKKKKVINGFIPQQDNNITRQELEGGLMQREDRNISSTLWYFQSLLRKKGCSFKCANLPGNVRCTALRQTLLLCIFVH